ncbi:hypothetical protein PENFLA_c062G08080 [Penicillium flavigenum]|uniref:BZIP domain-containing protein n=1 Tax=Penicillium flavigenum TaxID=254877 RepID=A0A1V6SGU0_9EURO|nr:hypothetical protein PENFLA_c062G08080 [Penicillium flavigenum]
MEHTVNQLSWPQGEAKQAGDRPADAETEANKQRRKAQNRKNQRARRLRLKDKDAGAVQGSRLFPVRRWRLNERDDYSPQGISRASESAATTHISPRPPRTYIGLSPSAAERTVALRGSPPTAHIYPPLTLEPQPFLFPLSSDHLLHLIQYNVFRALVSNKRTLNTLPTDLATCSATRPCRDDTTRFPLNPNIPPSLIPTNLQQTRYHSTWINVIPFPRIRDNLIRCEDRFDHGELMQDLTGELMTSMRAPRRRGTSGTATDPEDRLPLSLSSGIDTDEVTAGRNGLIVWGEPHELQSWEATPGFLAKWTWAVEGCEELVEISNTWRIKRGEEPMRLSVSRSYQPPLVSHVAQMEDECSYRA